MLVWMCAGNCSEAKEAQHECVSIEQAYINMIVACVCVHNTHMTRKLYQYFLGNEQKKKKPRYVRSWCMYEYV